MAYQYQSEDGHAKIGGSPSREEQAHGEAADERRNGSLEEWDPEETGGELP
ncbi:hypothetical protein [Natronorubrum bangense]|uniref:hypothetical protein n=1 Tax=Natronorubrum bangense TaxID=61858 RepID=UPI000A9B13C3|nr:hypothetical protein [Natronorubrum bangense]